MYLNKTEFMDNYQKALNELDHVNQVALNIKNSMEIKKIFFTGCGGHLLNLLMQNH